MERNTAPRVEFRRLVEDESKAGLLRVRGERIAPNDVGISVLSDVVSDETGRLGARLQEVEEQLGDIDAALHRLDEGTYGTCQSCGRAIPDERLEADPTARRCADCQLASDGAGPSGDAGAAGGAGQSGGG